MVGLRSKLTQDVLSFFFLHEDQSMYINELARRLGLDSGNLTRKLIELEKEGLFKSESKGNLRYYSLNHSYPLFEQYKSIVNQTIGFEKQLGSILSTIKDIKEAYLIGSYASDRLDTSSDVDLLVVGDHDPIELQKEFFPLQKKINREINLISIGLDEYKKRKKKDPLIKNILRKPKIKLI